MAVFVEKPPLRMDAEEIKLKKIHMLVEQHGLSGKSRIETEEKALQEMSEFMYTSLIPVETMKFQRRSYQTLEDNVMRNYYHFSWTFSAVSN